MEDGLLQKQSESGFNCEIWSEVKKLGYLAGPMVAVTLSQYLLQVISTMMVGHLGELSLSSTSIAFSLACVTGFTFLLGMASALETLSGQAYGAKQYHKLGTQTYTTIVSLVVVCIPIAILWTYSGKLLVFFGQDPLVSREAGRFMRWLIPALFAYSALQPLIRFYQMQSMIFPLLLSSFLTICLHVTLCWALVFKSGLGYLGAAVAERISMWVNVITLLLYLKLSPACAVTRSTFSWEIFHGMRYAIPSAIMICFNTQSTLYSIPYGLAGAISTRVSNELGAGNPKGARVSVISAMLMAVSEMVVVRAALFAYRHVFGYVFSNEAEVVEYVAHMAPLLCLNVIIDGFEGVFSGVARGCGWQHIGAYINLASFYLFGIPIAVSLAFWLNFGGQGLWIGILSGAALQTILLSIITSCTNWNKQAAEARERLLE